MSLSRIVVALLVLVLAGAVLSLVFNVLKAVLIVGVVGIALGIALSLRPRRSPKSVVDRPPRRPAIDR